MIRKHNRRAAKAAFAIALGVAIVLGGAAAAPAALEQRQATPIIIGTKNFPEQYVLGQLYKQALEAKGFKVQYKENIGSTELIDASLRSGRVTLYPEYTGIMLSVTFKKKTLPKSDIGTYLRREGALREAGADAAQADTVPGPRRDRRAPDDGDEVRSEDGRRPAQGLRLEARRVPGVRDAAGSAAGEPLRRQERRLHASGRDQRLLAAQPGQGSGRGDLHDRPAADLDEVRRAQGAAQHVRLPACRARPLEEARGRERDAPDLDAQSGQLAADLRRR